MKWPPIEGRLIGSQHWIPWPGGEEAWDKALRSVYGATYHERMIGDMIELLNGGTIQVSAEDSNTALARIAR